MTRKKNLSPAAWRYVWERTIMSFARSRRTDTAATLSFYFLLALLPALTAILSILNVFGEGPDTVSKVLNWAQQAGAGSNVTQLEEPLQDLAKSPAGGPFFVVGILVAMWSASKFVNAFGHAVNEIYAMTEGRPAWKQRLQTYLVTVVVILLAVAAVLSLVSSPSIILPFGLGEQFVAVWAWVRFPLAAIFILLITTLLYIATSNVKRAHVTLSSLGALIALVAWALLSVGIYLYAVVFGGFESTYGSLAGVLIALFWLWLSNMALLFGVHFDAEVERARQLRDGIRADDVVQVPPRDTRKIVSDARIQARMRRKAHALWRSRGETDDEPVSDPEAPRPFP
ncbi:YihY/virulence factor BrkB family protein [Brevibacterium sp. p3-SID960]|uniref:YihY/virulence factor BrkB family protein n=1 Tax=Brevibacterium sp. p3-SID960 TaxID=2916063 RepID=UPI0021A87AD5|nr:YihY/virulence factor BrkB family protein [Brevibacterium sp. p3-SID960]MCT1690741.1 YihY/virulence factor BrkB family protein [Brevibacterium sp. p3-SID960]